MLTKQAVAVMQSLTERATGRVSGTRGESEPRHTAALAGIDLSPRERLDQDTTCRTPGHAGNASVFQQVNTRQRALEDSRRQQLAARQRPTSQCQEHERRGRRTDLGTPATSGILSLAFCG